MKILLVSIKARTLLGERSGSSGYALESHLWL